MDVSNGTQEQHSTALSPQKKDPISWAVITSYVTRTFYVARNDTGEAFITDSLRSPKYSVWDLYLVALED